MDLNPAAKEFVPRETRIRDAITKLEAVETLDGDEGFKLAPSGATQQTEKLKTLNEVAKSLKGISDLPSDAKAVVDAVNERNQKGFAITRGVINDNVAKLLASLKTVVPEEDPGAPGGRRGKKSRKPRKPRRMTRRRRGGVSLFGNPNVARPLGTPGKVVRGSVGAELAADKQIAKDNEMFSARTKAVNEGLKARNEKDADAAANRLGPGQTGDLANKAFYQGALAPPPLAGGRRRHRSKRHTRRR
jgi:hypothetical protein